VPGGELMRYAILIVGLYVAAFALGVLIGKA
jgi:hypothetical protein